MSYGLKVYNTSNEVQIDSTYKNFSLHESGSWSADPGSYWYNFTATPNPPVVAIQPPGTYCNAYSYQKDSNSDYYQTSVEVDIDASAITLPYMIFTQSKPSEIPDGGYGLAVYNVNNDLIFHNFNKWLRIVSFQTFSNPLGSDCSNPGAEVDVSVTDADNNYFILRPVCAIAALLPDYTQYGITMMKRIDSLTLRIGTIPYLRNQQDNDYCYSISNLHLIEVSV